MTRETVDFLLLIMATGGAGSVGYWLGLAHGKLHELERPRREHEERERAKADKEDRPWKVKAP